MQGFSTVSFTKRCRVRVKHVRSGAVIAPDQYADVDPALS